MPLEKFNITPPGGNIGGGPDKKYENKETNIEALIQEFEVLTKIEKLKREDFEPDLDKVLDILKNEPEDIRPKNKKGQAGAFIQLKNLPTILIPDLHGRRDFLLKILKEKDKEGQSNLDKLIKGEIQMVAVGDALHTEDPEKSPQRWKKAWSEIINSGTSITPSMEEEIADSFGTMLMIMKLKELAPYNFHYLRGNHDDLNETYEQYIKYAFESSMVKNFIKEKFKEDFLNKYTEFEENLPLIAVGNNFVVSHSLAPYFTDIKKLKERALNYYDNKYEIFKEFCWTRLDNQQIQEQIKKSKLNYAYFYGHEKIPGNLEEFVKNIFQDKNNFLKNQITPIGIHRISNNKPTQEYVLIDLNNKIQVHNTENLEIEQSGNQKKDLKETSKTTKPNSQNKKEKKLEKINRRKTEREKNIEHFYEELQKIKDLEKNTERQKLKAYKESMKLLKDWLPFGALDNFEGIEELMNIMENNRPKTMVTFNYRQEKLAARTATEMALQWDNWENVSDEEKSKRIVEFINTWLKDKSSYYQQAEEFQKYFLEPPEKYLKQREKYGYFVGEKIEPPSKIDIWFAKETSTLLKLFGKRDRTLATVAEILALNNVHYNKTGIQNITEEIENQNIKNSTLIKIRNIEEMTLEDKKQLLNKTKEKLQTMPIMPLKIKKYEELFGAEGSDKEKELNSIIVALENFYEILQNPEGRKEIENTINKIKGILNKEKPKEVPQEVQKAKEFIKKNKDKKEDWWSKIGGIAGYSFLLLLVLFLLGEIKLGEKITGASLEFKGKK